jgi:hypothetical protein
MKPVSSQRSAFQSSRKPSTQQRSGTGTTNQPSATFALIGKLLLLSFILSACGGGGGGGGGSDGSVTVSGNSQPTTEIIQNNPAEVTPNEPSQPAAFTASLSWTAPITRENGEFLPHSEISGYEIYYVDEAEGDNPDCCMLIIDNPTRTSALIPINSPGTYFFSILAYDTNMNTSQLSEPVTMAF